MCQVKREENMNQKLSQEAQGYYVGLDIGTNSVGWAVTDPAYHLGAFSYRKAMWGIRLFESSEYGGGQT